MNKLISKFRKERRNRPVEIQPNHLGIVFPGWKVLPIGNHSWQKNEEIIYRFRTGIISGWVDLDGEDFNYRHAAFLEFGVHEEGPAKVELRNISHCFDPGLVRNDPDEGEEFVLFSDFIKHLINLYSLDFSDQSDVDKIRDDLAFKLPMHFGIELRGWEISKKKGESVDYPQIEIRVDQLAKKIYSLEKPIILAYAASEEKLRKTFERIGHIKDENSCAFVTIPYSKTVPLGIIYFSADKSRYIFSRFWGTFFCELPIIIKRGINKIDNIEKEDVKLLNLDKITIPNQISLPDVSSFEIRILLS